MTNSNKSLTSSAKWQHYWCSFHQPCSLSGFDFKIHVWMNRLYFWLARNIQKKNFFSRISFTFSFTWLLLYDVIDIWFAVNLCPQVLLLCLQIACLQETITLIKVFGLANSIQLEWANIFSLNVAGFKSLIKLSNYIQW